MPPQPSEPEPLKVAQVKGWQQVPFARQSSPVTQPGQVIVRPQPSLVLPQALPRSAHVFGTHTVQTPAEQISFVPVQTGQVSLPPQPSSTLPQLFAAQVFGVQSWHTLVMQWRPSVHAPLLLPHVN